MKIGMIGSGWSDRVQIPAFQAVGLNVVGIAARNYAKTHAIASKHGIQAFADWRDLVHAVDLVSIITPPTTHVEMACFALEHGKHVLCEKPTAMNATEAQAMLDCAQRFPQQLALIDHELRFLPMAQTARAILRSPEIGQIYHIVSTVNMSGRSDRNQAWDWWSDKTQGGGTLGAMGSHVFDLFYWLCGNISAIRAELRTLVSERPFGDSVKPVTSDDFLTTELRFERGATAQIFMNSVAAVSENTIIIHGENGALKLDDDKLWYAPLRGAWQDRTPAHSVMLPESIRYGNFPNGTVYFGHALQAWLNGDYAALSEAATFADGLRTQRLIDAAHQSNETGGMWVQV